MGTTMARTRTAALVAGTVTIALLAAACGGGNGSGEATTGTVDAKVQSEVKDALKGSPTTAAAVEVKAPTSYEEWEKLWAGERAAVVKRIKDNKWGKSADGKTLTGPEGWTVDLGKCPSDWSDTEGLTDTTIKIGGSFPLSGTAADFGNVPRTAEAWFKYHSEKGAFKDSTGKARKVTFAFKDDVYDAAKTIPLVDELLDSDKVFAIWTTGTPAGLKVYGKINDRCVPHPTLISGSPAWGDPAVHPWTTGSLLSYGTEAVVWGAFIDERIDELTKDDGKARVAGFVANSDFGATYESAFKAVLAESPNRDKIEFITERVEITAPNVTDPMTTLASRKPDVFITMTGGAQCPQIITEAANNGMQQDVKYRFLSSVCKGASFVGKDKVGGDGSASDGWYIVGGGFKDFNADALSDDPFVKWGRKFLADNGYDYKLSGNFGQGFFYAWIWTQALQIAGELDGGLTRTNFILAQRTLEGTSPVHLEGITINMNGMADAFFLEGSDLSIYRSAEQRWDIQRVIELSGKSANCTWDQAAQSCK
jgi:branched-chain amino acid transport system substrate-binding protein